MQAKEALHESEERFRSITENSADAIFITDIQGRYQYVNTKACDMLGYSRSELLGMSVNDISAKVTDSGRPESFNILLEKHRDQLEELVKERTIELEANNKNLERLNRLFAGRIP